MTDNGLERQSVLAQSVREIRRLRAELDEVEQARTEPIAIVGMGCRMPGGADSPEAFWEFLEGGGDGIGEIPASRWDAGRFYDPDPDAPGKMSTRRGGYLDQVDQFDPAFFGISPREAAALDPQQRLLLEVSWEALEHGGQAPAGLMGSDTGVYFGITTYDYMQTQMQQVDPADLEAYSLTGNASTFAAGRLSYWLGLSGPSLSVDTACSSSLVGVHLACQSLRSGETDLALAGGVNVLLAPEWFVVASKAHMLAADGRCKTFDASADGYVRSEGCGVVVLKRLSDARAQGDRILAVIRGSAVNQDGRSSGVTVPNSSAQQAVIRQAMRAASVEPAQISYVEAHGTGTPLGDPLELRALDAALGDRGGAGPLLVGSVKTNVGHLEPAAGVAGLIKVVQSMRHEHIPPHLHLSEVNPEIGIEDLSVEIPTGGVPWPRGENPRIAGVSSFGASGTNAHLIIEEAPADDVPETVATVVPERTAQLLTLSAKSPAALAALAGRYGDRLAAATDAELGDICFTAATGRSHFPHRLAVTAASAEEMGQRLAASATGEQPAGSRRGHVQAGSRPQVVFLFTGQGAQYAGMARTLYATEPVFRQVVDHCAEVLRPLTDRPLLSVLDPAPEDADLIHDTCWTQPALFTVEYALAELWRSWGVEPSAVLGHSIGELVAACVAGVLDLDDGLRLATRRGQLMHELAGEGAMAAVFASEEQVAPALEPHAAELSIAAVNGPESIVVSGSTVAMDALLSTLADQGVRAKRMTVTRAFHSPLMEPALDAFEREAAEMTFRAPRIPIISNVTGQPLTGEQAFTARYLREHARQTVRFHEGMTTLYRQGYRVFLEMGPAPTLTGMAKRFLTAEAADAEQDDRLPVFLPSLRPRHDDWRVALDSLGALYTLGAVVDWEEYDAGRGRRRTELPTYAFQRGRHWFQPSARSQPAAGAARVPVDGLSPTLLGERVPSPLPVVQFSSRLGAESHPCLGDCVMDGLPVVNVGVYLEAAFEAGRELYGTGPVLVEDCLVLQSMILEPGEQADVQLVVDQDPAGGERVSYRYFASGAQSDDAAQWVLHAQGRMGPAPDVGAGDEDLDAVRGRLTTEISGDDFYRRMWRRKLYLGPSAQWVEHIHSGAGEALARMRPPRPGEAEAYRLHPGLTDALFQTLFACLPPESPADATYMLVGIDRFLLHGSVGTGPTYCRARLLPSSDPSKMLLAEVRLYDDRGRLLAEADGVCLRRAERDRLLRAQPQEPRPVEKITVQPASVASAVVATSPRDPAAVRELLARTVARALGGSEADLDVHEPLQNLGLDSLMALEVKEALSVGLGVSLPLVIFLDGRSVHTLGTEILGLLGESEEAEDFDTAGTPDLERGRLPVLVPDDSARYEPFPLTGLQQAYLVGRSSAFELGNVSTYFFIEVDVEGVDLVRLTEAFRTMVVRHDMLRAVMTEDGHQRVLADVPPYEIRTTDLRPYGEHERDRLLREIHEDVRGQVFDTTCWPLFDVRATVVDERRTRLHIGLDALIIDAWSTSLLFREWAAAYRDGSAVLPQVPLTYRDYVVTARSIEGTALHTASLEYWRGRVESLPPAPELPLAKDPASIDRPVFTHRSDRITAEDWARFKKYAAAVGVTPSAALCTAYAQVLASWSKSSRFTLNVLFFNRQPLHPDVGNVVGNFSATTLLEIDSAAQDGFALRADRVQKQLWNDLEHSHVSGVEVLRELHRVRGGASRAAMPVVFASTVNFAAKEDSAAATGLAQHLTSLGQGGREVSSSIRTPQVWLDHQVVEDAGALIVNWDVIEEIFPEGMVDAMFAAYVDVLRGLCHDEQAWQRPAPVLVPDTDLALRRDVNATSAPLPAGLLHEPFTERAAAHPERTAVIAADRTLTYGDLDAHTDRLGNWLRGQGAGPGSFVGIVMEKGWEQVAATIGVLKSGAAYVPIDAAVPPERLRLLLEKAGIALVLTQSRVAERLEWPDGTVRLSVDGPEAKALDARRCEPSTTRPDDLAYVIFTSGSTGTPKGVMIEHTGALNTVLDINERFGITEEDRVLALSALNFDLSVYDVFGVLAAGGAIVLPEPEAHREPARWAQLVSDHGVTLWNSVPSLMEMFTEYALGEGYGGTLALRTVMMSGDWIPVTLPDRIRALVPDAAVWSLGGATEASIWSILHPIGEVDPSWASIPYGTPMRSQQFHVFNDAMQPCPVWVPGHLHVGGVGLARGYLGDEAKTRAAFLRHPSTGEQLYRTGDLGRYLPDGTIEFLGREDFQVKVQGYRIELGEIEAALLQCPGVRAAVVSAVGERQGAKQLVAYAVLDEGRDPLDAPGRLREALGKTLPVYMVPQHILVLDGLPLTANGKVDRTALPVPGAHVDDDNAAVTPRDDVESELAVIWSEFFPDAPIGVHADFFALGGNSLLAVRLMARIHTRLGCSIPLSTLFGRPTIALLAEAVRDAGAGLRRTALVAIRTEGSRPPLFFVHPVGGDVLCYAELAALLGEEQPFYALQVPDGPELSTVAELGAHYAEAITAVAPIGPYRLGGWSMGGVVALEIAQQLAQAGKTVEHLAVIDLMEPPGPTDDDHVDDAVLLSWFARDLGGLNDTPWEPGANLFRGAGGYRQALGALHAEARRLSVLSADIDVETLGAIFERFARNFRALLRYQPETYDGPVRFFRARDGATEAVVAAWQELFPDDSHIVDLPGDHYTVMQQPQLRRLADELNTWLDDSLMHSRHDDEGSQR
ncbi:hybrid non-ribosomal peptide synthetase/type I polyketide synthase [Streptomyces sp. SM1]|uniref:hybrid non-ribosomal peptide synthetase/type I polyketide synthase n=1 Tax=Streptomyces sp. SM1 TaxID=402229 RepID=UPI000CD49EA6|nr:hybrid non-ribosomal peptide synthetase/type I polyketide synthase [Streptomyces sp. SM1]